jgi:hypothetical protein
VSDQARTFEFEGTTYLYLETAEQADELVSDDDIQDTLESWFGERRTVPEEDFIDRLVKDHGGARSSMPFEIESYDSPASRRLLSRARKIKKELND